jgi:5'-nucleotidase
VGVAYSQTLTASGDTPITWTATGMPGWATLDSNGTLHGTPNAAATTTIHATATNATGSNSKDLSLTVGSAGSSAVMTGSFKGTVR